MTKNNVWCRICTSFGNSQASVAKNNFKNAPPSNYKGDTIILISDVYRLRSNYSQSATHQKAHQKCKRYSVHRGCNDLAAKLANADPSTACWEVFMEKTMVYYVDKYGFVHSSKESCLAANRS